jgi:hypothetical protein
MKPLCHSQIAKNLKAILVACLLVQLSEFAQASTALDCESPPSASTADMARHAGQEKTIAMQGENCTVSTSWKKLLERAANGDDDAATSVAAKLVELDGGELEDALIALGAYSSHRMSHFARLSLQGTLKESDFERALVMLPESQVDDLSLQLKTLTARRKLLAGLSDQTYRQLKTRGIQSVDSKISEITRILSEETSRK